MQFQAIKLRGWRYRETLAYVSKILGMMEIE